MLRYRSLPVLAVRRMLGNWRLLSSVVVGTVVAAAIISATSIYADAIRDLGLQFALEQRPVTTLDVSVSQSNVPVDAQAYQRSRTRVDQAVGASLGPASGALVRQGTSATFFPTEPGDAVASEDPNRPRANLRFRSDIEPRLVVLEGEFPAPMPADVEGPVQVAIGPATAERSNIAIGDQFDLHPFWDDDIEPLRVEVVGIVEPLEPEARYWAGDPYVIDDRERSWQTYILLMPETSFFGAAQARIPTLAADYGNHYSVRLDALDARNAAPIADRLSTLEVRLGATETRTRVQTDLVQVLRTFDEKLFFTQIPLLVLLLQIGGIVAYYLVMVSTMLIERQAAEIATLRSRGATTWQLLAQYGFEGAILAVLAALTGPPIAGAVISALGPTPAFSDLSDGGPLDVHIGQQAYILAGLGALIAFAALMIPAWRATRTTVVEFKRSTARPKPTPLFLRYYLDVALVLLLALVFWRLSQQEQLFTETLFGETQADPFLLTTPAVFMLTVGIVFLRLFPLVLVAIAWLVGKTRSVGIFVGMRSLVRNPTHYTRLILLLMFATGVGMFGATFAATLDRSYEDRAGYAVGADVRASAPRALSDVGDVAFLEAIAQVPADAATPILRSDAIIDTPSSSQSVTVLGIEPETFDEVTYFREDFSPQSLDEMLATLEANSATLEGIPIPEGARQIGLWLKMPDIRAGFTVYLSVRDANGRPGHVMVAGARPGDPVTEEWVFFAADLENPLTRSGTRWNDDVFERPLTLHGVALASSSRIGLQRGVVHFGPVMTSAEAPPPPGEGPASEVYLRALDEPFEGAEFLHDLGGDAFEPIQGLRPFMVADQARPNADAPPGFEQSIRFSWTDDRLSPSVRGLRQRTDDEPVLFYLSSAAAEELGLEVGDPAGISLASRYAVGELAGVLEYFPTLDPGGRNSFAVVNASRLTAAVNASPPDRAFGYNEAWFSSSDPEATREALAAMEPRELMDVESEMLQQQEDPLVAAGWQGILAISFGAVLLLSAIGFVVYSYLTAQQRGLEFAILRTLGFSRPQIFAVVLFEHLFVIAAGMGLGTVVGLQVGRLMMDFLATDERGAEVLPPFQLAVSWPEIFAVWGILGMVFVVTIGAVVLLYFRLAVHRALRIGDV